MTTKPRRPSADRAELEVRAESLTRTIAVLEGERARLYVAIAMLSQPKEAK